MGETGAVSHLVRSEMTAIVNTQLARGGASKC